MQEGFNPNNGEKNSTKEHFNKNKTEQKLKRRGVKENTVFVLIHIVERQKQYFGKPPSDSVSGALVGQLDLFRSKGKAVSAKRGWLACGCSSASEEDQGLAAWQKQELTKRRIKKCKQTVKKEEIE